MILRLTFLNRSVLSCLTYLCIMAIPSRTYYSKEEALQKARHYCGYQERCHQEVKEKLYGFGLKKNEVEEILSTLIEDSYLNEERFAIQYAGGKFRIKQWGKIKIKSALKQKQVSDYCIKKALASIPEDDYAKIFAKLAEGKQKTLKGEKNQFIKKRKITDYLLRKGYETDRISRFINE